MPVALSVELIVLLIISYTESFQVSAYYVWMKTVGYTMFALFWGTVLTAALDPKPTGNLALKIGMARWLQVFGKYSYSMYLTHVAIMLFLERHFWTSVPSASTPFYRLVVIPVTDVALTLALGWLTWHLLEKHALGLKDRHSPWGPVNRDREANVISGSIPVAAEVS